MREFSVERCVMWKFFIVLLAIPLAVPGAIVQPLSTSANPAASAINSIGIDLLHQTARPNANALLSPYSIETALAMTYAGADGTTREEMARVLHLDKDQMQVASEFGALQRTVDGVMQRSIERVEQMKKSGGKSDPVTLTVANRLFGQKGYAFRPAFTDLLKTNYDAPFQAMDFVHNAAGATKIINSWVEDQTKQRIQNLIPDGALTRETSLVLVNAIYLKAPWAEPFEESATKPEPFHAGGTTAAVKVPTMSITKSFGYTKTNGVTVVSLPYNGGELQFLIILPDDTDGLERLEAGLTAQQLAGWANLPNQEIILHLPKFKMQPPTLPLGEALQQLGMKTAFDKPKRSANFDLMAPRKPDDYLYISDVFHKTFLSLDEKGTEAAAATAVVMMRALAMHPVPAQPVEVRVDHPFLFAIQHKASGACLFLGHVVDPR